MNKIFLAHPFVIQKLENGSEPQGKISGNAYTGAVIPEHGWIKNLVIDLSTLKVAKKKTPILRDHNTSQVAGHAQVSVSDSGVAFDGVVSKKSEYGKEILDLAADEFEWEMSLGVYGGKLVEIENETVNGHLIANGTVLRNGLIREISVVSLGADKDTNAQVFNLNEGDNSMLTKEQWVKLACACGGNKETTPEELEAKFAEDQEKIDALKEEIEALKNQIREKEEELKKIQEEEAEEEREEEIASAAKEKGIKLSAEKIKEAAKSEEKTKLLLDIIAEMETPTVPDDLKGRTDLGSSVSVKNDAETIRIKAEQMVKAGEAEDFLDAIQKLEVK